MKKIFIIGGMGYIGSRLAQEAVRKGYGVVIYDSLVHEQDRSDLLDKINKGKMPSQAAILIVGDTRNKTLLDESIARANPMLVVHFGELVGPYACEHNPTLTRDVNFFGSKNVVDICAERGIPLLYNSSSSVYGNQKGVELVDEKAMLPAHQWDNYCRHKFMMEEYIKEKVNTHGRLRAVMFRPATVGGIAPRIRLELLPNQFTYCAYAKKSIKLSDADSYRSVIDVKDLVDAYMKVIERMQWNSLVYNIGSVNLSKAEYAKRIQNVIPCEITVNPGIADLRNLQISSALFENEFSYKPQVGYEDMISGIHEWVKHNKDTIERNNYAGIINVSLEKWLKMI